LVGLCAHEWPFTSKSLHKIFAQMSKRKKQNRGWPQPLWYKVDPDDPRNLILRNGTRVRQSIVGIPIYVSQGAMVYTLTQFGLRPRRINFCKKRNYRKRTRTGNWQGQRYPFILFRNVKYELHVLVTLAWERERGEHEEIDHIDGNIDDCRLINLRVISDEENDRCAGILRRMRNAAKRLNLPFMNPLRWKQADLIDLFERFRNRNLDDAMAEEVERFQKISKMFH